MTNLLAGLLAAALSTNAPVAVSNVIVQNTGLSIPVVNTNDPLERAYHKVLEDDDAAQQDVIKWSDEADSFNKAGAGDSKVTLAARIRQRLDGIKKEYRDFLILHPEHVRAHMAYGSFLYDTKDEEGAVDEWEKARQLDPNDPAPWNNLANYYGHRSPVKKAFEYYAKAISLDPKEAVYYHNFATTVYLFRKDAEEYYHLNETQVFDKALELYRQAIALTPDDFILFSDYAESFYGTKPPRWKDGLEAWTQSLKIAHDDVERQGVYVHLARINIKLRNFAAAQQDLNTISNEMYSTLKGRLLRNLNEAEKGGTNSTSAAAAKTP